MPMDSLSTCGRGCPASAGRERGIKRDFIFPLSRLRLAAQAPSPKRGEGVSILKFCLIYPRRYHHSTTSAIFVWAFGSVPPLGVIVRSSDPRFLFGVAARWWGRLVVIRSAHGWIHTAPRWVIILCGRRVHLGSASGLSSAIIGVQKT